MRSIPGIDATDLIEGDVIGPLGFELVRVKRARAPGQVLRVRRGGAEFALRVLRADDFNVARSLALPDCAFVLSPSRVRFAESGAALEYELTCTQFTGAGLMAEDHVQFYAAGVLLGLEAYHASGQVYWDFTQSSVVLDSAGFAVLLPYIPQIEVKSTAPEELHDYTLDLAYFAPELLSHELDWYQHHSFASNMWSFGVWIYHRLTGRVCSQVVLVVRACSPIALFLSVSRGRCAAVQAAALSFFVAVRRFAHACLTCTRPHLAPYRHVIATSRIFRAR